MNSKNRKTLSDAEKLFVDTVNASIDQLRKVIESMYDSETDKMNNLPESLQEVTTGQYLAEAIEMLEEKIDALDTIAEEVESSFAS